MLNSIVRFAIARRAVVLTAAAALLVYGLFALSRAGLDVFPEFAPKLVVVQTEAPGLSAEQVEVLVTQRLEGALGGLVDVDHLRSESIAGLSVVTVAFAEGSDIYRDRSQVAERLAGVTATLPVGVGEPLIAPLASSAATVRTIGITGAADDPLRLRDIAVQVVVPRLLGTPGVADVNVFGGAERALLVEPREGALVRLGLALDDLVAAVRGASAELAIGAIENRNQQLAITATATLTPERLAAAVVRHDAAGTITLGDVASVRHGALPRISAAQIGGQPAVVMMVIGQLGVNMLTVSNALERSLADLTPALTQQQVSLHTRLFVPADYIVAALGDLARHLLLGGALVLAVLVIGLHDLRAAFIAALAIPLSLLSAALVLIACGVQLNVLVIGGLAIALGEVVDDAIIDTENILRRLRTAPPGAAPAAVALAASLEVRGSVVYATFIVALVFVPLLTLGGVSGRLFAPLGMAYILAVLASLVVAVTITPALCVSLLGETRGATREAPVFRWLGPRYAALVGALARRPRVVLAATALSAAAVAALLPGLGARFLPELREGHFIVHTTGLPGTSLDESIRVGTQLTRRFLAIPGVTSVSQWAGRAARGADTYGSHYSEYEIGLTSSDGAGQQRVLEALRAALSAYPGLTFEANTFLTERIDETISGYVAPVVVNLYGSDLELLDAKALELAALVRALPGAREVRARAAYETPTVNIELDPRRLAHYGLSARSVLEAVQSGYSGLAVGATHYANRRVPITVLLDARTRGDAARLGELIVARDAGGPLRLAQVATLTQTAGRYSVLHRDAQRLQVVTADVAGGDLEGFMRALRAKANAELGLPDGMHLEFTGAAVAQGEARRELIAHAALAGLGVLLLAYVAVERLRHLLLILANLPFSLLGGVLAVMAGGGVVSVGAVVGFVTLFGITVRNSIMLVSHYQYLVTVEGCPWQLDTALRGARERLPAILMTALVTALAMLPLAVQSDNPGREIMGPMAAIIVGGLLSSTLLNLLVMPALLFRFGQFGPAPHARV